MPGVFLGAFIATCTMPPFPGGECSMLWVHLTCTPSTLRGKIRKGRAPSRIRLGTTGVATR